MHGAVFDGKTRHALYNSTTLLSIAWLLGPVVRADAETFFEYEGTGTTSAQTT